MRAFMQMSVTCCQLTIVVGTGILDIFNLCKMVESVGTEMLIDAVKERPALWDTSSEEYKDKNVKKRLWIEICQMLYPNFDEMDGKSKSQIGTDLQKKWKHVRDAYVRSLRAQKTKSGQGRTIMKTYVYAAQLLFLKEAKVLPETESSIQPEVTELENNTDQNPTGRNGNQKKLPEQQPSVCSPSTQHRKHKNTLEKKIENYIDSFQNATNQNQERRCDDLEFFQSLLPFVKNIPINQKLSFRLDVMKTVMQYVQTSPTLSFTNQHVAPPTQQVHRQVSFPSQVPQFVHHRSVNAYPCTASASPSNPAIPMMSGANIQTEHFYEPQPVMTPTTQRRIVGQEYRNTLSPDLMESQDSVLSQSSYISKASEVILDLDFQ